MEYIVPLLIAGAVLMLFRRLGGHGMGGGCCGGHGNGHGHGTHGTVAGDKGAELTGTERPK